MSQPIQALAGATAEQANNTQEHRNPYDMLQELDNLAMNHPGGSDRSPHGAGAHPKGTGPGASNPPNQYTNSDQPEVVHQPLDDPFDPDYGALVDEGEELRFFTQRLRVFCTPPEKWERENKNYPRATDIQYQDKLVSTLSHLAGIKIGDRASAIQIRRIGAIPSKGYAPKGAEFEIKLVEEKHYKALVVPGLFNERDVMGYEVAIQELEQEVPGVPFRMQAFTDANRNPLTASEHLIILRRQWNDVYEHQAIRSIRTTKLKDSGATTGTITITFDDWGLKTTAKQQGYLKGTKRPDLEPDDVIDMPPPNVSYQHPVAASGDLFSERVLRFEHAV